MPRRLKVLIGAYACSPRRGSEAGVGWGWVRAISEFHDVWVIAGDHEPFPDGEYRYRDEIEAELDRHPELRERMHFHYIHKPRHMSLERIWSPSYLWFYRAWEKKAFALAAKLQEQIGFDLAHQITYVAYRVPGYLWRLGIPFVWGPIGGLENTPWRFLPSLGWKGALYYTIRNIGNSAQKRFLRRPKRAFKRARGGIISATEGIRSEILRHYGQESEVLCEIGPPPMAARTCSVRREGEPLRLAWSGQHHPGKALPLLLKAVALLKADVDWRLDILGEGPCTTAWQRLARRSGIAERCSWRGWLPRDEALNIVHDAHIFVITSIKDLTSTVLLEALSQGVPVVCLDHCGFHDVVTPECGIKVPVHAPRQVERDLAAALEKLWSDEPLRRGLGENALLRVKDFSWERKAERVNAIYQNQVGPASSNPELSPASGRRR